MSTNNASLLNSGLCPLLPEGLPTGMHCEAIDRYHMVAEHSRTVFWEVDAAGLFTRISHVALAVWGFHPSELIGQAHFFDLHPSNGRDTFRDLALSAFRRKDSFRDFENPIQRRDGATIWVSTTAVPILGPDGTLLGYRGSDTDVTERHTAEEALLQERRRLANVIEGTNAGIWDWNIVTGEIIINERWAQIIGYSLHELLPHTIDIWVRLAHPDDLRKSQAMLADHFAGRIPYYDLECRMRHKDGHWIWVHDRGRVTERDPSGTPRRVAGTHTDITVRKQAEFELLAGKAQLQEAIDISELAQERLWLHMQGTPLAYVELDTNGLVSYWNPAAETMFGFTRDEVIGHPIDFILTSGFDSSMLPMFIRSIQKTLTTQMSAEHSTKDGRIITCEWCATLLVNSSGDKIGVACLGQDITERRLLMGHLRRAKEKAEAAARAKSEFLSMMSHEIRTPMNGIIGLCGLLLDSQLEPEQRGYAKGIRSSADGLLSIINDILDFSKVDAGRIEIESIPFDLQCAVEDVLELASVNSQEKDLEVALRYPPDIPREYCGDVGRIRQVVLNLVTNAVKFTPRGMVLVEVQAVPIDDHRDEIRIAVHDTGVGISPNKFHLLFSQFTQLDSSDARRFGGSGLGLAISRRLAHLMDGDIQVVSDSGEGSTFTFHLPLSRACAHPAHLSPSLAGVRALLVDSRQVSRFILTERCASWGIAVEEACSGAEALDRFKIAEKNGTPFAVVIIDHTLADMDAGHLACSLHDSGVPVPIVLLAPQDAQRYKNAFASEFFASISRPVRSSVLYDTLARILGCPASPPLQIGSQPTDLFPSVRVLLVEDNAINQRIATALLRKLGVHVEVAGNGCEALEMVTRFPFDLIIMDCQMPEMDGFQATREIRQLPAPASNTPIVALTAGAMEGDRKKCFAAGMNDFMAKPILPGALVGMLAKWTPSSRNEPARLHEQAGSKKPDPQHGQATSESLRI